MSVYDVTPTRALAPRLAAVDGDARPRRRLGVPRHRADHLRSRRQLRRVRQQQAVADAGARRRARVRAGAAGHRSSQRSVAQSHAGARGRGSGRRATRAAPLSPERWGQYAYYNNLGIELRSKGKMSDAVDAFDRAIDINPTRPIPHLNEAMTMFDRQQYTRRRRAVPESRRPRPAECGELLHRLRRALPRSAT